MLLLLLLVEFDVDMISGDVGGNLDRLRLTVDVEGDGPWHLRSLLRIGTNAWGRVLTRGLLPWPSPSPGPDSHRVPYSLPCLWIGDLHSRVPVRSDYNVVVV